MKRLLVPVLMFTGVMLTATQTFAAKPPPRGPSTPEERAKAVELVKAIEADPLGQQAADARRWLIQWTTEIPDIEVNICAELPGPSGEVALHPLFAQTKFAIEHPDKANDNLAAWTAGTEGMLRVYEVILKAKPDARLPFLDDLVAKRDRGDLGAYIAEVAKKCK